MTAVSRETIRPVVARRAVPRTEERVLPAARCAADRMLAEHLTRYRFVAPTLRGRVLDLGCGTGYGALELSRQEGVREVLGVDRSAEALAWARRYYPDSKIALEQADVEERDWHAALGPFDGIVAFEILEHLADESALWLGIRRALDLDGVLWISTPVGRGRGIPASDPFHVHQLRRSECEETLRAGGWEAAIFGQTGTWIEPWVAGRRYRTILARARAKAGAA